MRKRRLSSFELDALVVVKVNVPVNISVSVDHCVSLVFSRFEVGGEGSDLPGGLQIWENGGML